jgi:16S rRNA (guanine527-N7)-methyltransferase
MSNSDKSNKPNSDSNSPEVPFDKGAAETKFKKWFPDISDSALEKLLVFQAEFIKCNKISNFLSSSATKSLESDFFADSILSSRLIEKSLIAGETVYDFSGGLGFPGLVFSILFPKLKVEILDRDVKRLAFGGDTAKVLGLTNVQFNAKSFEDFPEGLVGNAVYRGAAQMHKIMLSSRKPLKKGGKMFLIKGDGWAGELAQVPSQLFSHWSPELLGQFKLPEGNSEVSVVLISKISD